MPCSRGCIPIFQPTANFRLEPMVFGTKGEICSIKIFHPSKGEICSIKIFHPSKGEMCFVPKTIGSSLKLAPGWKIGMIIHYSSCKEIGNFSLRACYS